MKKVPKILLLVAFAICIAFFACSSDKSEGVDNSSSSDGGYGNSSSSGMFSSSSNATSGSSSSQDQSSAGSSSSALSSDSAPIVPGANCAYLPIWCGGIEFDKVKTASMDEEDIGASDKGQERPNCIYATAITQIGNESGGVSINGTTFANGSASRCGGDSGHGYGSTTPCATKFASIARADGGYYIYIPRWAGQNFKTTGGEPVCNSTPPATSSSATTTTSSSSAATGGNTGSCIEPAYGLPVTGVKTCIKKDGKCYICNPDRGDDCKFDWIWAANSIDDYWYKEISCSESGGGNPTYNLTCTSLAQTGVAGTAITQPTVKCNADNISATFTGAPAWNNPVAGTFNVSASANCGGNKSVSCGSITVSAAPTASTLTCSGLAQSGVAGTAITQPTVKCGNSSVSNPTFTGAPTWTSPTAGSYTVSANATSTCTQAASCGTIKVNPKLTCGNPTPQTVTAGTAVTAPTVTCGEATVTNISWSGAPTYWSSPAAGTYNNVKATANSGDCNGQTATCGTLTVNSKLECEAVTQAITTGQTPTKPKVTCGSTTVTSGITWSPTSINSAINTAQTISGVTATASCSGSNQTANCAGTITVTAPPQSSQSSTPSSSSTGGGGGSPSYTPTTPGNESSKVTQYWDACKPSCSWSGKGGKQANSCNITGTNIGHNDGDRSACDGGNAFTCMNQAPWKVGNVSFGYVAAGIGQCGDCWQFDFPNGHVMVVMKTNIGDIKEGAKFDLMIPGGGVGDFDALSRQVTNSGVSNPDMGVRYGGFRGKCGWDYSAQSVNCVKDMCNAAFKNLPDLKAGCLWWTENLGNSGNWNNPTVKYKSVTCPSELTGKY